jgi:hypothetical protein
MWDPSYEWYETLEEETARKNWKPCPKHWLTRQERHDWQFENPDPRPREYRANGKPKLRIARLKCANCGILKDSNLTD